MTGKDLTLAEAFYLYGKRNVDPQDFDHIVESAKIEIKMEKMKDWQHVNLSYPYREYKSIEERAAEIEQWCQKNLNGGYHWNAAWANINYLIENEEDAVLFKLTWK